MSKLSDDVAVGQVWTVKDHDELHILPVGRSREGAPLRVYIVCGYRSTRDSRTVVQNS
jgi:hypothetical protein